MHVSQCRIGFVADDWGGCYAAVEIVIADAFSGMVFKSDQRASTGMSYSCSRWVLEFWRRTHCALVSSLLARALRSPAASGGRSAKPYSFSLAATNSQSEF